MMQMPAGQILEALKNKTEDAYIACGDEAGMEL
jgi:hypothetical protein